MPNTRNAHPSSLLADMYDPMAMPPNFIKELGIFDMVKYLEPKISL